MFYYSSHYHKQYKKLSQKIKDKVFSRLEILIINEFDPILNNHSLHGEYGSYRSINITGDIRLIYKRIDNDFYLITIGTPIMS